MPAVILHDRRMHRTTESCSSLFRLQLAEQLVQTAVEVGSTDDVTAVVFRLDQGKLPPKPVAQGN